MKKGARFVAVLAACAFVLVALAGCSNNAGNGSNNDVLEGTRWLLTGTPWEGQRFKDVTTVSFDTATKLTVTLPSPNDNRTLSGSYTVSGDIVTIDISLTELEVSERFIINQWTRSSSGRELMKVYNGVYTLTKQ